MDGTTSRGRLESSASTALAAAFVLAGTWLGIGAAPGGATVPGVNGLTAGAGTLADRQQTSRDQRAARDLDRARWEALGLVYGRMCLR